MSKKLKIYIIIATALILIIIVAQLLPKSYSLGDLRSFHVRDTASISKVFLVDKNNRSITLERKNKVWYVNGEENARPEMVNILLETLINMRVKMPVAMSMQEQMFKNMAGRSIKVEIYTKGKKPIKVFYVGGVTQDNLGSYMLLEGSENLYVVEIPGFRGFLSSRFSTDILNWKSHILIGEKPETIKKVEILWHEHPKTSFTLLQPNPKKYELYNFENKKAVLFDTLLVKGFLEQFEIAHFSQFVQYLDDNVKDSVLQSQPVYSINLTDHRDSLQRYDFYRIPEIPEDDLEPGDEIYPQTMWVFNNKKDWVIIQTFTFLMMFRQFNDFRPKLLQ